MGMAKPVHVLSRGAEVTDVANMAAIAVVDAQTPRRPMAVHAAVGVRQTAYSFLRLARST